MAGNSSSHKRVNAATASLNRRSSFRVAVKNSVLTNYENHEDDSTKIKCSKKRKFGTRIADETCLRKKGGTRQSSRIRKAPELRLDNVENDRLVVTQAIVYMRKTQPIRNRGDVIACLRTQERVAALDLNNNDIRAKMLECISYWLREPDYQNLFMFGVEYEHRKLSEQAARLSITRLMMKGLNVVDAGPIVKQNECFRPVFAKFYFSAQHMREWFSTSKTRYLFRSIIIRLMRLRQGISADVPDDILRIRIQGVKDAVARFKGFNNGKGYFAQHTVRHEFILQNKRMPDLPFEAMSDACADHMADLGMLFQDITDIRASALKLDTTIAPLLDTGFLDYFVCIMHNETKGRANTMGLPDLCRDWLTLHHQSLIRSNSLI